jgi:hypothetical protein
MDECLLFMGLTLGCFGLGFGFGLIVSLTSTSMYLPPPPGPPGTYFSFLMTGPSTTAGSEFTESWRGALELFLSAPPGEERCFGEEKGAILGIGEIKNFDERLKER